MIFWGESIGLFIWAYFNEILLTLSNFFFFKKFNFNKKFLHISFQTLWYEEFSSAIIFFSKKKDSIAVLYRMYFVTAIDIQSEMINTIIWESF